MAAGATLMPVKVLDQDNRGTELALVDGIHWAVDHGAHVINMSLSFPLGYTPSQPLREALQRAHDAGIVLVAAAGNNGAGQVTWPAASRLVIAVAGARAGGWDEPTKEWDGAKISAADYSNLGAAVDLVAPGGTLDLDPTGDGYLDGLLAETIHPNDPTSTGYWFYAGTSQACALVSGAAVHLLDAGGNAAQVRNALKYSADSNGLRGNAYEAGTGAGGLRIDLAITAVEDDVPEINRDLQVSIGMLPYLARTGTGMRPAARLWAVDHHGQILEDGVVYGTLLDGGVAAAVSCELDKGRCTLTGQSQPLVDEGAWVFTVDTVVVDDISYSPSKAIFATDGAEVLLTALSQSTDAPDGALAFYWEDTEDPVLGRVREAWSVVDSGTGLLSSPMGLVLRTGGLTPRNFDESGLVSSPMGSLKAMSLDVDGTGLLSSPMGLVGALRLQIGGLTLVGVDGSGLLSSPLGFHPTTFYGPGGTGLLSSPMGFHGQTVLLGTRWSSVDLGGSTLGSWVAGGGWLSGSGREAASELIAMGTTEAPGTEAESTGAGALSMQDAAD